MKTLVVLVSMVVILFVAAPNKIEAQKTTAAIPAESTVNTYLRNQVISQSGGALSLSNFRKTNGYAQGYGIYVMEWQGDILFVRECWKSGDMLAGYWQDFGVLLRQPQGLESVIVGVGTAKHFDQGANIRLTGNATLRNTEQGWRVEGLIVKTTQSLAASAENLVPKGLGNLYIGPNGDFSYNPPDGWTLYDDPPSKTKVAEGPSIGGSFPSIRVVEDISDVPFDDWIAMKLQLFSSSTKLVQNVVVSKQATFMTDAKAKGIKIITQFDVNNVVKLKSTLYFFDGHNNRRFVVYCSSSQGKEELDNLFDKSMRTFKTPASTR